MKLRAERSGAHTLRVPVIAETDLGTVLATLGSERPDACVIDSGLDPRRGRSHRGPRVGRQQVWEVAGCLMENAKRDGVAVILVGHDEGGLLAAARPRAPGGLRPQLRGRA